MHKTDDIILRDEKEYKIKDKTCSMCNETHQVAIEHGHGNWRVHNVSDWKTWNASRCSECHKKHNSEKRKKPKHQNCDMCGKALTTAITSKKRYCSEICRIHGYASVVYSKRDSKIDELLKQYDIPDNSEELKKNKE